MKRHWTSNFKKATKEECTSPDGVVHDSVKEMQRWCRLQLFEREGYITDLTRQIPFPLTLPNGNSVRTMTGISKKTGKPIGGRIIVYTVDFRYVENGETVYEEYKGFMAEDAALKLSMVEAIYNIKIKIVKKP